MLKANPCSSFSIFPRWGSTLNPILDWNYDNKSYQITRYAQIAPFLALSDAEKLLDYYDESLLLMKRSFNWQRAFYSRQNVNKCSKTFEELPKATQSLIEKVCEPELALSEFAEKRLLAQIEAAGEAFADEVKALKAANQRFSQFYHLSEPIRHSKLWFALKGIAKRIIR